MNRRQLLKSIGAIGLVPMLPALPAIAAPVHAHIYARAEMIVRAHNSCSLAMLQRLLKLNASSASALQSQLVQNGIIGAQANAYGIHTAINPLFKGAFLNPPKALKKMSSELTKATKLESKHQEANFGNESNINTLEQLDESNSEQVESICEDKILEEPIEEKASNTQSERAPTS